ncbi:hypothetical protein ACWG0P_02540 [Amedibacillus sp. YH-ame6]
MSKVEQRNMIYIGNTSFYVISKFTGTVELQHLIKRLIQQEIRQKCFEFIKEQ